MNPLPNHDGLIVMLAAGFSRRFGSAKLLQKLSSGETIIATSIAALKSSGMSFVVAIRNDDDTMFEHVRVLNAKTIRVSNASQGLASVIAECASNIETKELKWLGIYLADMPYISPVTITNLCQHASSSSIIQPRHKGTSGHPVLFGSEFFTDLCQLEGDDGAKLVLKRHSNKRQTIDVEDAMISYDIDRPEDII